MTETNLNFEGLLQEALVNERAFQRLLTIASPFRIRGILHSEMLMCVSLIRSLRITRVIETGRAGGQSTEILARWLRGNAPLIHFDSIELDDKSADALPTVNRINDIGFPVNLHFGDANVLLPELLDSCIDSTLVLIDGPKGIDAVTLAFQALMRDNVKVVCIHDIHKNDKRLRAFVQRNWSDLFASDHPDFVRNFSYLDDPCWKEHQQHNLFKGWGPYKRGRHKMLSYGPTLLCFLNSLPRDIRAMALAKALDERRKVRAQRRLVSLFSKFTPSWIKQGVMRLRSLLHL